MNPFLNLFRQFMRPTLRASLEEAIRESLRPHSSRRTSTDLMVFVSEDLVPAGIAPRHWVAEEEAHLEAFTRQWAMDHAVEWQDRRLAIILLDTIREFAHVKPTQDLTRGLGRIAGPPAGLVAEPLPAVLEVTDSAGKRDQIEVRGRVVLGRSTEPDVRTISDRHISRRHVELRLESGALTVTDLHSRNGTSVNLRSLVAGEATPLEGGDVIRLGMTELRVLGTG